MSEIAQSTIVPNLIIGTIVIVAGVLVIVYRRQVRNFTLNGQRSMLGRKYADATEGGQTTGAFVAAGVCGILVGAGMLAYGIVGLVQYAGG